jgi:hypothetical protein
VLSKLNQQQNIPWLGTVLSLQVLDLVTFLPAVLMYGIVGESNPVMVWAYESSGFLGVAIAKLVSIGAFIVILKTLRMLDSALLPVSLGIVGGIGLLGTLTNLLAIWISL